MLYIVELNQEGETLVLMQISERRLPCHGKTVGECLYACCQKWNLVLIHKCDVVMLAIIVCCKITYYL